MGWKKSETITKEISFGHNKLHKRQTYYCFDQSNRTLLTQIHTSITCNVEQTSKTKRTPK